LPQHVSLLSLLGLGFFLGMRHATDSDHVVAVTTIVSRERSVISAGFVGALWGLGHTVTILLVGGAIIVFGLVLPPRIGLCLELVVALMLVLLGALNVGGFRRAAPMHADDERPPHHERAKGHLARHQVARSLAVGTVHGLAGSAAVALLVLAAIRNATMAMLYLLVFCAGTVAGMMLITAVLAVPIGYTVRRFAWARHLGWMTGVPSVALGLFLIYQIGFVDGLFGAAR
jgi:high-affinity nickel-transport protein